MRVYAVSTTGIYCRPDCPARRPRPEHVRWFADGAAARRDGYRACKRCRPGEPDRAARAMAALCRRIEADPATASLAELARLAGLSRFHLLRAFRRVVGVTPRDYARACRRREDPARPRELRWSSAPSPLGRVYVARSERGICAVSLGRRDFPAARLRRDDAGLRPLLRAIVAHAAGSAPAPALPLDVRATAFEERVWRALRAIPAGETRSYGELARAIGRPGAARAVGRACAANRIALLIPCHRAVRADGSPGGYRWGIARKRALLAREQESDRHFLARK
jgi:AraC family transcriptional regulator, regulatory protein of adaptative response / methylated-DNA-[protein]-cysteine methyltransferase